MSTPRPEELWPQSPGAQAEAGGGGESHPGLPAALPDLRTAVRLLEALAKLETRLQQREVAAHAAPAAPTWQVERAQLTQENLQLKARQQAARARLETLLGRVQALVEPAAVEPRS